MNVGMLWFDNDPKRSLSEKVQRAAEFFAQKHGREADTCLVQPASLASEETVSVPGIAVRPWRSVPTGHLWIGVEDATREERMDVSHV